MAVGSLVEVPEGQNAVQIVGERADGSGIGRVLLCQWLESDQHGEGGGKMRVDAPSDGSCRGVHRGEAGFQKQWEPLAKRSCVEGEETKVKIGIGLSSRRSFGERAEGTVQAKVQADEEESSVKAIFFGVIRGAHDVLLLQLVDEEGDDGGIDGCKRGFLLGRVFELVGGGRVEKEERREDVDGNTKEAPGWERLKRRERKKRHENNSGCLFGERQGARGKL